LFLDPCRGTNILSEAAEKSQSSQWRSAAFPTDIKTECECFMNQRSRRPDSASDRTVGLIASRSSCCQHLDQDSHPESRVPTAL
jgi:hypothetical protein